MSRLLWDEQASRSPSNPHKSDIDIRAPYFTHHEGERQERSVHTLKEGRKGAEIPDDVDEIPPRKMLFTVILIIVRRAEV